MKLTKLHIFIIILVVLILCPTLGACSIEGIENFENRTDPNATPQTTFHSYGGSKGLDQSLDTATMAGNQNSGSNNNTSYSHPRNAPTMSGSSSGNSNSGGGSGGSQSWFSWFKNLF